MQQQEAKDNGPTNVNSKDIQDSIQDLKKFIY